jgi:hypothetical protein
LFSTLFFIYLGWYVMSNLSKIITKNKTDEMEQAKKDKEEEDA